MDGVGSTWRNNGDLYVGGGAPGGSGSGVLNITGGGQVSNSDGRIGYNSGSTGEVTVDGTGSTWTNSSDLNVGRNGNGTLNVTNGGAVSSRTGYIGHHSGSMSEVTVNGPGSTWTNRSSLRVGYYGSGVLNITGGGLVSVGGILTIDYDEDGDCFINMGTGGMLALYGDADDSLFDFLGLIDGTDAIRYWDDSISGWADIAGATYGDDYTLSYLTEGDLTGYTMLTVDAPIPVFLEGDANNEGFVSADDYASVQSNFGATQGTPIPEPATLSLLGIGGLVMLRPRRK